MADNFTNGELIVALVIGYFVMAINLSSLKDRFISLYPFYSFISGSIGFLMYKGLSVSVNQNGTSVSINVVDIEAMENAVIVTWLMAALFSLLVIMSFYYRIVSHRFYLFTTAVTETFENCMIMMGAFVVSFGIYGFMWYFGDYLKQFEYVTK